MALNPKRLGHRAEPSNCPLAPHVAATLDFLGRLDVLFSEIGNLCDLEDLPEYFQENQVELAKFRELIESGLIFPTNYPCQGVQL